MQKTLVKQINFYPTRQLPLCARNKREHYDVTAIEVATSSRLADRQKWTASRATNRDNGLGFRNFSTNFNVRCSQVRANLNHREGDHYVILLLQISRKRSTYTFQLYFLMAFILFLFARVNRAWEITGA